MHFNHITYHMLYYKQNSYSASIIAGLLVSLEKFICRRERGVRREGA